MLRTVFMGTPDFAVPALETLSERTELLLVVTQPDRRAGRGRKLYPPPVKARAVALGVEVAQPEVSLTRALAERLEELRPDVIVVAAFGKLLGRRVLRVPSLGCINIHASLLPLHRGASPPVWSILSGDAKAGVTIQRMVLTLDAGDVLAQRATPIDPDETGGELTSRLSVMGGELLVELLEALDLGAARATAQDHDKATYAPMLSKKDGELNWCKPAKKVHDRVRAMNPWPVAYTQCPKGRLRIHRTRLVESKGAHGQPGEVIKADRHGVRVACGQGVIELLDAQREGKAVASATELVCGRLLCDGELFGNGGEEES